MKSKQKNKVDLVYGFYFLLMISLIVVTAFVGVFSTATSKYVVLVGVMSFLGFMLYNLDLNRLKAAAVRCTNFKK